MQRIKYLSADVFMIRKYQQSLVEEELSLTSESMLVPFKPSVLGVRVNCSYLPGYQSPKQCCVTVIWPVVLTC